MSLGKNDRFAGIKPRHGDTALHGVGARGKNSRAPRPFCIAQQIGDDQLGVAMRGKLGKNIFIAKAEINMAVALHGTAKLAVNGGMSVAHAVRDQLAHEVQHARAVSQSEPISLHAGNSAVLMFRGSLQTVQIIVTIPFFEFFPIARHLYYVPVYYLPGTPIIGPEEHS